MVLSQITSQAPTFQRVQPVARDWDLSEIAESALKLHTEKIARHRVSVESSFQTGVDTGFRDGNLTGNFKSSFERYGCSPEREREDFSPDQNAGGMGAYPDLG
jgi:hypothetical protein